MTYRHVPVLLTEVLHYLNVTPGGRYIDGTLGGGGHTNALVGRSAPDGQILSFDLDPQAHVAAKKNIADSTHITFVQDNFKNIKKNAHVHGFTHSNGILLDLGLSSGQLQDHFRGFSFLAEGRLDMRFGAQTDVTAEAILNTADQQTLYEIFRNFGEERLARPISKNIIEFRRQRPITTPKQLVDIITGVYGKRYHGRSKFNPATKVFQALRIAVNEELENLKQALPDAMSLLVSGGRLAVISYHSLEDRIVKDFFKQESRDCICSSETPVCVCGHHATLRIITKKPVVPTDAEIVENPRARSAKLRVAEKI